MSRKSGVNNSGVNKSGVNQMERWFLGGAGFLGAMAVAAGAFGSHVLAEKLSDRALAIFETAARYQLIHALLLGMVAVAMGAMPKPVAPSLPIAGVSALLGMVLFSGSLYALSFGAPKILGVITPIGGVGLIVSWLAFWLAAFQGAKP